MKKLLVLLLSLGLLTGTIINISSKNVFADGMQEEVVENKPKLNIVYIEYSILNDNGNILKSLKHGQYVVSDSDTTLPQEPNEDNAYLDQNDDLEKSNYQNNNNDYKIHPINKPEHRDPRTNRKKPRPIMPIIDTDVFNVYYM